MTHNLSPDHIRTVVDAIDTVASADMAACLKAAWQLLNDAIDDADHARAERDEAKDELRVAKAEATFMESLAEESKKRADAALGTNGKPLLETIEEIVAWTAQYDSESDEMDAGRGAEIVQKIYIQAEAARAVAGSLSTQLQQACSERDQLRVELSATRESLKLAQGGSCIPRDTASGPATTVADIQHAMTDLAQQTGGMVNITYTADTNRYRVEILTSDITAHGSGDDLGMAIELVKLQWVNQGGIVSATETQTITEG